MTKTEDCVSELEYALKELHTSMQKLTAMSRALEAMAKETQNRARRYNLCFVGFPEGVEGGPENPFWRSVSGHGFQLRCINMLCN